MPLNGQPIRKEVIYVFISGTKQEIEWLIKTLANGCQNCPYEKECSKQAEQDVRTNDDARVQLSCEAFLKRCIEFQIVDKQS